MSRIKNRSQLFGVRRALNFSLNLDRLAIGPDYPIFV